MWLLLLYMVSLMFHVKHGLRKIRLTHSTVDKRPIMRYGDGVPVSRETCLVRFGSNLLASGGRHPNGCIPKFAMFHVKQFRRGVWQYLRVHQEADLRTNLLSESVGV